MRRGATPEIASPCMANQTHQDIRTSLSTLSPQFKRRAATRHILTT
jgi:hypothetical protein